MPTPTTSNCTRCGKQRVIVSVKEEIINGGVVTYTETSCPDPVCQKIVEGILKEEDEKRYRSALLKQQKLAALKK
jgi:hypothetical protein